MSFPGYKGLNLQRRFKITTIDKPSNVNAVFFNKKRTAISRFELCSKQLYFRAGFGKHFFQVRFAVEQNIHISWIAEVSYQWCIGQLSYKDFFLQTNQRRSNALLGGTELGYQLYTANDWQLDIIAKAYMQGFDSDSLIEYGGGKQELLAGLRERSTTAGISLRYSRYIENALFNLDIAVASPGNDQFSQNIHGVIVDSFYSYLLPYRNWDIYLGAGLTYFSQNLMDYYIGVGANEVTEIRPEYTAESGLRAQLEVYAHYPLSTSWSFNTGITQSIYSDNIKKSPIVDTNHTTQVMIGVLYVF